MTCIVGYVQDGVVFLGGDSLGSDDYLKSTFTQKKVFKSKYDSNLIIGLSGNYILQFLQYEDIFMDIALYEDINEYLITRFVPNLRELVMRYSAFDGEDNNKMSGELMFGYQDKLFKVQEDYSIIERKDNFDAMGTGEATSLGALNILRDNYLPPIEKIRIVLKTSSKFNTGVAPPFYIINTLDDEIVKFEN